MTTSATANPVAEGQRRKLDALALLEARRGTYILRGRRALLTALCWRGHATADDVRAMVPLPAGIGPVCLGAVPGALARAGIIEGGGYAPSRRADAHARPNRVWHLRDRAAALAWLKAHPHPPDPQADTSDLNPESSFFDDPQNNAPGAGDAGRSRLKGQGPCETILPAGGHLSRL